MGGVAREGIQSHFLSAVPFCRAKWSPPHTRPLNLNEEDHLRYSLFLWKRFFSAISSTMRTTPGVFFFSPSNRKSGLSTVHHQALSDYKAASPLLISVLSSQRSPFAISCAIQASPVMERNNAKLLGWFMQVIVCVYKMPFIWGPQRALGTLSHWRGPAPTSRAQNGHSHVNLHFWSD